MMLTSTSLLTLPGFLGETGVLPAPVEKETRDPQFYVDGDGALGGNAGAGTTVSGPGMSFRGSLLGELLNGNMLSQDARQSIPAQGSAISKFVSVVTGLATGIAMIPQVSGLLSGPPDVLNPVACAGSDIASAVPMDPQSRGLATNPLSNLLKNIPNASTSSGPTAAAQNLISTVQILTASLLSTITSITSSLSAIRPLVALTQMLPLADSTKFAALQGLTSLEQVKQLVTGLTPEQLAVLEAIPLPVGPVANPLAVATAVLGGVAKAEAVSITAEKAFSALFLRSIGHGL